MVISSFYDGGGGDTGTGGGENTGTGGGGNISTGGDNKIPILAEIPAYANLPSIARTVAYIIDSANCVIRWALVLITLKQI